jgi:tetratricopeptide (TPR) repeat protein
MNVATGDGIEAAQRAANGGHPDEAAAILDERVKTQENVGEAVPMLAQLLRDNARDVRLLNRALAALSMDITDCGSHDHLEYKFRRRIVSDRIFEEIGALAFSRPEATFHLLALVDDLVTAGRIDEAEAQLRKISRINYKTTTDYLLASFALAARNGEPYLGLWEYLRGRIALAKNELPTALEAFTSAAQNDPRLHSARALAGHVCRKLGMGAKACDFFDLEHIIDTDVYRGF